MNYENLLDELYDGERVKKYVVALTDNLGLENVEDLRWIVDGAEGGWDALFPSRLRFTYFPVGYRYNLWTMVDVKIHLTQFFGGGCLIEIEGEQDYLTPEKAANWIRKKAAAHVATMKEAV